MDVEYYEQLLQEKDLMLEKAAQVIELLKKDVKHVNQIISLNAQRDQLSHTVQDWDQYTEIQFIKKLLTQETITFHQENFKTSMQNLNYRNELEQSIKRESKLKQFIDSINQNVQHLVEVYTTNIEEPITLGIQQILFEFEIWNNNQEKNSALQLQIADDQLNSYSQLLQDYKNCQHLYSKVLEIENNDRYLIDLTNFIQHEEQLNLLIEQQKNITIQMTQKIEFQNTKILKLEKQLEELKKDFAQAEHQNQEKLKEDSNNLEIMSSLKKTIANQSNQLLEYLHMIDEYEQLLQGKIDLKDYNKVAQLFEQALIDLENLQNKYENKQFEVDKIEQQISDFQNRFTSVINEIKEQLVAFTQNPQRMAQIHSIIFYCNKQTSKKNVRSDQNDENHNTLDICLKMINHPPKHRSGIRSNTPKSGLQCMSISKVQA